MSTGNRFIIPLICFITLLLLVACPARQPVRTPSGSEENGEENLGRYVFDTPTPFTDVGNLDTPRLRSFPGTDRMHLAYLIRDGTSQRVMYTWYENNAWGTTAILSQREGQKRGGGYIDELSPDYLVAYWINVMASGGQLYYKISDDAGRTFSIEARWNELNEARMPCVMKVGNSIDAYFFIHSQDEWNLVVNRNFQTDDEEVVATAQGTPFHLQGITDGRDLVCLAYFTRRDNSDGGRLALVRSTDGGATFDWAYLFEDRVINSISSFFRMASVTKNDKEIIYIIFTEESPDMTTLYYSRSEGGEVFTAPIAIIESEITLTHSPLLLANDKHVFIATADTEADGQALRYVYSEDYGMSFDAPVVATHSISNPESPTGYIDRNGKVMIIWDDLARESSSGEQLYLLNGSLRGVR